MSLGGIELANPGMSHNSKSGKCPEFTAEAMKAHLETMLALTEPIPRLEGKVVWGKSVQRIRARPAKAIAELFTYINNAEARQKLMDELNEMHVRMTYFEQNWHASRGWQLDRRPNKRKER